MNAENLKTFRKLFNDDDYVFIPQFLSLEEVHELNVKLKEFIKAVVPTMPSKHGFYEE